MKVGIIGCVVMGSAMARIIRNHHEVFLYTRRPETLDEDLKVKTTLTKSIEEIAKSSDMIILAVKPKDLEALIEDLDPALKKGTLVLSILVGTTLDHLKSSFPTAKPFRLMPNLPLLCGKGLIGIAEDDDALPEDKESVDQVLSGLGSTVWLDEKLMNPFAALTGSSPAFICLIIEAMVQAGIAVGFKSEVALELVLKTVEGTAGLLKQTGDSPSKVRQSVASPRGTTVCGLNAMEANGVRHGVISGILQTFERGEEMEA